MKKFLSLLVSFMLVVTLAKAQYVTIPDSAFNYTLKYLYPTCFNAAGQLDTSNALIINEDSMLGLPQDIKNLEGIQYFKSLKYLSCYTCYELTTIPSLPTTLTYLNLYLDSNIVSFPVLPNSLEFLDIEGTKFSSLPALPTSLKYLNCFIMRSLSYLPSLPVALTYLNCGGVPLTALPTFPPNLDTLICSESKFTKLSDLPASLTYLICSFNASLISLPSLPNSLKYLNCSNNNLTYLPSIPASLTTLFCSGNPLTHLPLLPNSLQILYIDETQITSLPLTLPDSLFTFNCSNTPLYNLPPILPKRLTGLFCSSTLISALPQLPDSLQQLSCYNDNNLYCLPRLPVNLFQLEMDTTHIDCLPNSRNFNYIFILDTLDHITSGTLPLCNPTNNTNHCAAFPIISGTVFYDNNNNGIKDVNEFYKANMKMQLSNGLNTFTNTNGYYEISATDGIGSYALSAYAPPYFKAVPAISNYTFNSYDTIATKTIAIYPVINIDSLFINVFSSREFVRPGLNFLYSINYQNAGTTNFSPLTITFDYANKLLIYDSCSNPSVVNNGSNLTLNEPSFAMGQNGSFIAYFTTKTTDLLGDSLTATAIIQSKTIRAADSENVYVRTGYDPNDKEATPQLTPDQVQKGKSIQYTIRFQNTGTDTAFNIVIADTLSSLLQYNSLQMISSSKPCKVTVDSNIVYFEFLNVLLPDSATNSIGSNGYVSFSVQPQPSVSSGSIPNTAFIYFDYNVPVVTNTATTLIQDGTVPLRLLSFTALIQPGTTNALLYWNTTSEINTKSFIIEQSTDGISFSDIATVAAKGYGGHSYSSAVADNYAIVYYRLKMVDNNGSYSYSPIVKLKASQAKGFIVLNNPVKDIITIKTDDESLNNTAATLINEAGIVVKRFVMHTGTQTVDVSNLPAGSYYLQTQSNSLKVIIAR